MCPPHVDQTTRSCQTWSILAPSLRQKVRMPMDRENMCVWSPRSFSPGTTSWGAFQKLARPKRNPFDVAALLPGTIAGHESKDKSLLESLPSELIAMVISDSSLAKTDVMALGLCSQSLWIHVADYIHKYHTKSAGPWAGVEIACTGTWLQSLPSSFYELFPEIWEKEKTFRNRGRCPARVFNWNAISTYKDVHNDDSSSTWQTAFDSTTTQMQSDNRGLCEETCEILRRNMEECISRPATSGMNGWLLRDLTAKEYVSLIQSKTTTGLVLHLDGHLDFTLDDVLVMRVCWGYKGREPSQARNNMTQGVWAGHAFEVVEQDGYSLGPGWTDVTAEIIVEVVLLVESDAED